MVKLIYAMLTSLDGYIEDVNGGFGWCAPEDEAVHAYINELGLSIGTHLYGRKMYETMIYWETADTLPDQPKVVLDWAQQWQAAEKIVYSRTLPGPSSAHTRIEQEFVPDAIRQFKVKADQDISISGPELAAQAVKADLVDEIQMIVCPVIVGGGKRFFPEGVRLKLNLLDQRWFDSGVVALRYTTRMTAI